MALTSGTRLGVYEIVAAIGAGGMGEVYRARDTRLRRDVALKVLAASHAPSVESTTRLRNEAQALAALNHPGIAAVYDFQEIDGACQLIMELVPGRTLAEMLAHGPLPVPDAIAIARQIAEALDAAHEKHIVHRDLKPANVKVTPEGRVKILDFGLAKLREENAPIAADAITIDAGLTQPGLIVGTIAYMSPEQARGLAVDRRTDIWAFGCVLYELLCGRRVFDQSTEADIIAAILRGDPPLVRLPNDIPVRVRELITRCLRPNIRHRLRDIGDAILELDVVSTEPEPSGVRGAIGSGDVRFLRLTDSGGVNESPAISPDGKMIAFVANRHGRKHLWIRLLAGGAPLQLTRDDVDHEYPRWTPDSSALVYYVRHATDEDQGTLWEMSALGGAARPLASAVGGGDVSHDGRLIAAFQLVDDRFALALIPRDGGPVRRLDLPAGRVFECPRWAPDDRAIAYVADAGNFFDRRIYVHDVSTGHYEEFSRGEGLISGLDWLADGRGLVFGSGKGSLLLYPPAYNLRAAGRDARPSRALTFGDASFRQPDVHPSGFLAASRTRFRSDIWKFPLGADAAENMRARVRITSQAGQVQVPSLSPDGKTIVFISDSGGHGNLWLAQTDGSGAPRQLTFERDPSVSLGVPIWSPHGRQIAYLISRDGRTSVHVINADGTGRREVTSSPYALAPSWSADGQFLYHTPSLEGQTSIAKTPVDGGDAVVVRTDNAISIGGGRDGGLFYASRLRADASGFEFRHAVPDDGPARTFFRLTGAHFPVDRSLMSAAASPDEQWLAMSLVDGPTNNIFVVSTAGGELRRVTDFGDQSVLIARRLTWSPDSRHVYAAVAELDTDVVLLEGLV